MTNSFQVALNISDVSAARAAWVLSRFLDHVLVEAFGVEDPSVDDPEALDVGSFLKDADGGRGHRAREDPPDVRMVTSRGREEDDLLGLGIENWSYNRDVG